MPFVLFTPFAMLAVLVYSQMDLRYLKLDRVDVGNLSKKG